MNRNKLIQTIITNTLPHLDGLDTHLEFWAIAEFIPNKDGINNIPPNAETVNLAVGPITRKTIQVGTESFSYIRNGITTTVPFNAIYCIATDKKFGKRLGWNVDKNQDGVSLAYVNLVEEHHNI